MRKFIASLFAVLVLFAVATAEEEMFSCTVTKFEGGKITIKKIHRDEITLALAANAKYMKAKRTKDKKVEADGELKGGKEAFEKLVKDAPRGLFVWIIVEGEGDKLRVNEIRVFDSKKK